MRKLGLNAVALAALTIGMFSSAAPAADLGVAPPPDYPVVQEDTCLAKYSPAYCEAAQGTGSLSSSGPTKDDDSPCAARSSRIAVALIVC